MEYHGQSPDPGGTAFTKIRPEQSGNRRRRGKKEEQSIYVYKQNTLVDFIDGKDTEIPAMTLLDNGHGFSRERNPLLASNASLANIRCQISLNLVRGSHVSPTQHDVDNKASIMPMHACVADVKCDFPIDYTPKRCCMSCC